MHELSRRTLLSTAGAIGAGVAMGAQTPAAAAATPATPSRSLSPPRRPHSTPARPVPR